MKQLFFKNKTLKNKFVLKKNPEISNEAPEPLKSTKFALKKLKDKVTKNTNTEKEIPHKKPNENLIPKRKKEKPIKPINPTLLPKEYAIAHKNRFKNETNNTPPKSVFANIEDDVKNRPGFNPDTFSSDLFA